MENEIVIVEKIEKEMVSIEEGSSTGGTNNYNNLTNKPKINNVELKGNKTSKQLGLQEEMDSLTNMEIEKILNSFVGG